jgi:serine/threonine protein kinase
VAIGSWIVERPIAKGDICDVHYASSTKNSGKYALKIAHHGSSNDLMDAEAAAIKVLHVDKRGEHYKHYIPKIHASFEASGRRVNVIQFADGYYPLSELTAIFNKIEFRHSVWMMNRALSALGFVHNNDIIHGAVLPEHLLYCPKTHHMVLVDWCYSVKHGEPLRAIVKQHKAVYPKETTHPSPATDIYMLAMIIQQSAREIPSRFRGLLDWATADSHKSRPSDAWTLQDKWTSLAEEEYGPAKFVELVIPNQ